jgi:Ribosomal protein S10p/S20e
MFLKIKVIVRDPFNSIRFKKDFLNLDLKKLLDIKIKKKTYKRRKKIKFTTLKSPHVHKDAQHTFELTSHFSNHTLKSNQISKILSYYKKLLCRLTPDAKLLIVFKTSKRNNFLEKKGLSWHRNTFTKNSDLLNCLVSLSFVGKNSFTLSLMSK